VSEKTVTKVAYFAAGTLVAGLLAATLVVLTKGADDEERPPIIVRGGSLIFESGDKSGKPKHKKGKLWIAGAAGTDWQPDHDDGISVVDFTIAISGGDPASCPTMDRVDGDLTAPPELPLITVTYTVDGTATDFTLTIKPDQKKPTKKWSPTVVGSNMRLENDTTDNPQLVFGDHQKGEISRVRFRGQNGDVDCKSSTTSRITSLKIWQDM